MWFKVQKNYQEIIHFSLSSHDGKIQHGKIGLRVLDLNQRSDFNLARKQTNNILKLTNYIKIKCIQPKNMTNKKQTNKQNTKQRKKT